MPKQWDTVTGKLLRAEARDVRRLAKLRGLTTSSLLRLLLVAQVREQLVHLESKDRFF